MGGQGCWETLSSNIFRLKICTPQQQEIFAPGKIKDNTGNLYSVISWAGWYLRPHWVSELNALTRSPCSVSQTCFNCESKFFWYEIYWAGNGKEEQGQHHLPRFDRGMGKYQRYTSKRNVWLFFSITLAVTFLSMRPVAFGVSSHQLTWART